MKNKNEVTIVEYADEYGQWSFYQVTRLSPKKAVISYVKESSGLDKYEMKSLLSTIKDDDGYTFIVDEVRAFICKIYD